jgi:tetratricopeptide (TPR) repeat protein
MGREEPAHWNRRAGLLLEDGDVARATEAYQRSLDLYPNPDAWSGLAAVRIHQGNLEGALAALHQSLETSPSGIAWSGIGVVENQLGRYFAAEEAFERSMELAPNDPLLLQRCGQFWLQRGDRKKALAALERAAAIDPSLPWIERDLRNAGAE